MPKKKPEPALPKIHTLRKQKVVLDADLAVLYGVPTKRLNEAVKRNADRFPGDFCFQLTREEVANLRSQFATLRSSGHGKHSKHQAQVFTEHGALMAATFQGRAGPLGPPLSRLKPQRMPNRLRTLSGAPSGRALPFRTPSKIGFHSGNA